MEHNMDGRMSMEELFEKQGEALLNYGYLDSFTIKEHASSFKSWSKTGLLEGIEDPWIVRQLSLFLENQRLFNSKYENSFFNNLSIPLVLRTFHPKLFIGWEIASVQAMLSPASLIHIETTVRKNGRTVGLRHLTEAKAAFSRRLPCSFKSETEDLNERANILAELALEISNHFNLEIVSDLSNSAYLVKDHEYSSPDELLFFMQGMSAYINSLSKAGEATFCITNGKIVDIIREFENFEELNSLERPHSGVRVVGRLNNWDRQNDLKVIENNEGEDEILFGIKGKSPFYASYAFCPYVPYSYHSSTSVDDLTSNFLLSRYSKIIWNNRYYGLVKVTKLPEFQE